MTKIVNIFLAGIILFAVFAGGGGDKKSSASSTTVSSDLESSEIVKILEEEIRWYATTGVKEGEDGRYYCRWGNRAFKANIGENYAWCATFVSYMLVEKFHVYKDVGSSKFLSRAVSGLMSGGKNLGIYYDASGYTPQIGDIVIQKNGKSHTGIYIGKGRMIAGNTGNRVNYQSANSGLSGYIHINYRNVDTGVVKNMNGNDNAEKLWNYMIQCGFTKEATAGILGNADGETGFNPKYDVSVGASRGYGIFCMTDQRAAAMRQYASKKYGDQYSLQGQLEYFVTVDAPEQFKKYTGKTHRYSNGVLTWWPQKMSFKDYSRQKDISKSTEIFMRVYERPGIPHLDRRIASAKKYFKKFGGG